jgi:hypothetical protein
MKLMKLCCALLLLAHTSAFALTVGKVAAQVKIGEDDGGKVNGAAWSSTELTGKVTVFFYVDPDEKDLNNALADALKKEKFTHKDYQSIAVINMAATWAPNFAIESKLKDKQKEFPTTIYVKDKNKILVKKWNLGDDNNVFVLFDKEGKVLFHRDGKVDKAEIDKIISLIKANLI